MGQEFYVQVFSAKQWTMVQHFINACHFQLSASLSRVMSIYHKEHILIHGAHAKDREKKIGVGALVC